jgi:uncharacterized protein HemX
MDTETAIVIVLALAIVGAGYVMQQNAIGEAKKQAASQWGTVAKIGTMIIGM